MNKSNINTAYHEARIEFSNRIYNQPNMMPHRYVFILTNKCNLRCSFCFQEKKHIDGSLNADDWVKVVDQLPEYAHITITGGEPFLFKDFEKVFIKVTDRNTCNIISNGLLLTDHLIDLILSKPNFKVLSISVDNIANSIRGISLSQWGEVEYLMKSFTQKRDKLRLKTVLDSKTVVLDENADFLAEIHEYCMEKLSCDTHSFMFLKGAPIQYADNMHPLESMFVETNAYVYKKINVIAAQFEKVRQYNLRSQKKCFVHPKIVDLNGPRLIEKTDLDIINRPNHVQGDFLPCKAPWESVHINVDGSIFPCMAISMGNVNVLNLSDIVHGNIFTGRIGH